MSGLHGQILGHLAKRAIITTSNAASTGGYSKTAGDHTGPVEDAPFEGAQAWQLIMIFLTFAMFLVVYASVKYTLGEVVSSLAMIEQPKTVVVSELRHVEEDDNNKDGAKDHLLDEEVTIYREKPITASIRQTIRHLSSVGGYTARWRGLSISVVYHFMQALLGQGLSTLFALIPYVGASAIIIGNILATVLLARIHMTWTHIMISNPSPLPWYRRVPHGRTYFKALITPALIFAIAQYVTALLPMMVFLAFGPVGNETVDHKPVHNDAKREGLRLLATISTMIFVGVALLLPASVTLTRVEASLLPDDSETIVNFDRTLGGAAANLVGFGKINFRALYDAAWRSFDKSSRIRLIKFYAKYISITVAIVMLFSAILAVEASFGSTNLMLLLKGMHASVETVSKHKTG
ncbi:Hypothetical protein D9617_38g090920 [Elsinoe fawcettii]|nr:Hypothetical protein D9617_38g090920 [Elsinoe fawcettii]